MKANLTIKHVLALAAALLTLASCVEKERVLPPLSAPGSIDYEADFGSLSLYWTPVDNAGQYFWKVENALGYTVAKGTTTNTSVVVSSLQPATTYTVRVKAVPKGVDAETYAASEFFVTEATTAAPKQYDFEWSYPATIWWYYDTDVYRETKGKTTFGYDKTLKAYVIQAWAGVMGMDIVFTLSDSGEWLINYDESTAYLSGPDGNAAVGLAHGIGGTSAAQCWFYTNNTGSSLELSSSGGRGYAWMYNPDGNWTGYCVEFGEYVPDPPAPYVPDPDADESWSMPATVAFDGEELGTATVTFDAASGLYTVADWYGVEGHGIAFTRDAETGKWVMDTENSSAYIDGPYEGTGLYELSHGKYGKGMASTLLLDPSDSGYEGDAKNGDMWAAVTDPSGKKGTYTITWVTDMTPFRWACDIYVGGNYLAQGTISYNAELGEYKIESWHGVEGYDVVFTMGENGWVVDFDKSSAYLSGPDGNGAVGLAHGIEGAALANCWFYPTGNYGEVVGDSSAGYASCWMYNYDGNWSEYRVEWKEGNWSAKGKVTANGADMGTATISYDVDTQTYTLSGWYGVAGYDVVFTLREGTEWNVDYTGSSACNTPDGPDANNAIGLIHGVEGAPTTNCWFYVTDGYSYFNGGSGGGAAGCWIWTHLNEWALYEFTWPAE